MRRLLALAATGASLSMAAPEAAQAAVTININQSGSSVVVSVSGTLNLDGLTDLGAIYGCSAGISPAIAFVGTGGSAVCSGFEGFGGSSSFGNPPFSVATSGSGDLFGFNGSGADTGDGVVFVDPAFVSGSQIVSGATFDNETFALLGLTIGQYVYTSSGDSITVNIGQVSNAVPEPATWAMMLLGFGAVGYAMRRRKETELAFGRAS